MKTNTHPSPISTLKASKPDVITDLDPHLQKVLVRSRQGVRRISTASTRSNEVAVIAKVNDLKAWRKRVRRGTTIGRTAADGTTIITARVPVSRIESLRRENFVVSLKAARRLRPQLSKTIEETGSRADLLPVGSQSEGGRRAIVGIIDFGFDFMHENFRNDDEHRTSRALAIWDQKAPAAAGSPSGYGRLHTKNDIDAALRQPDPYVALGYGPPAEPPGVDGSHGTHVADIAAGNGNGSGVPGVAPKADIVFVEAASSDLPSGPAAVGSSFGDSVQLLEAISFIFDHAGNRPCSINISLATNGGPHDGSTLVEQGIDRMLTDAPNRAVTIAAGNTFVDGIHATGVVQNGGHHDLIWDVPNNDSTNNELELWYSGTDRFAVEVIAPNQQSMLRVEPGDTQELRDDNNQILMLVANRLDDPNNNDNMIGVFLSTGLPLGRWTVRLHGVAVQAGGGRFHAWIERDDPGQSRFAGVLNNSCTLGSISCGHETIVVGSYDAHLAGTPLAFDSSSGKTRDNRPKPEVSAPGQNVFAARSLTDPSVKHNLVTHKSGTSMAAPTVAGIIALILSEAESRNRPLTSAEIRDIVIRTARRNPPPGGAFDPRFGNGRVSGAGAVAEAMALLIVNALVA
jgi:subtilisin family serine protease